MLILLISLTSICKLIELAFFLAEKRGLHRDQVVGVTIKFISNGIACPDKKQDKECVYDQYDRNSSKLFEHCRITDSLATNRFYAFFLEHFVLKLKHEICLVSWQSKRQSSAYSV
jgi:hypothetical protein